MKRRMALLLSVAALAAFAVYAPGQSKPAAGFDQMKSLVGEWDGKAENGKAVRASYTLVSAGTALVETLNPPDESEMVTVYHADGNHVAMTHYCDINNQPRMRTGPVAGPVKELDFSFVGATNLASPAAGHMHKLVVRFDDNNHFTQTWTWREQGKEMAEVFHFTRKK
jgi:hypothetical protein